MMFKLSNAHYENFLYLCIFLNSNMPCSMDVNFAKPQLTLFFLSFSDADCANSLINMLVRTSTLMLMYTEQILVTQSFSFWQRSIARQGLLRSGLAVLAYVSFLGEQKSVVCRQKERQQKKRCV